MLLDFVDIISKTNTKIFIETFNDYKEYEKMKSGIIGEL